MPHYRYQFPCNHLRGKVCNLMRHETAQEGNFYLLVGKLPPELSTV
jgi:hypothetical protein